MPTEIPKFVMVHCTSCSNVIEVAIECGTLKLPGMWSWLNVYGMSDALGGHRIAQRPACPSCIQIVEKYRVQQKEKNDG